MEPIYLDHAATTPLDQEVIDTMYPVYKEVFGNPSSIHSFGRKARFFVDQARRIMAKSIHANEREIVFTSGGTEADNMAMIGTAKYTNNSGKHIITSVQEHHAILHTAQKLEKEGYDVTYLPVYENGKISMEDLENSLRPDTFLVSIMAANNETGVIQPVKEIGDLLRDHPAYFHTDAVQLFGLMELNVHEMGIDLLTVSSHKINGPKGIGFIYIGENVKIDPLQFGGEQERKRRPGTENVVSVVGFQKAVELAMDYREDRKNLYQSYKDLFLEKLRNNNINFRINGEYESTIPSIVNISFPGTNVEALLTNFDLSGIAASSGSACTAGSVEPSHVLSAMYGVDNDRTVNSIRFSFGSHNTKENVIEAAERVTKIVHRLTS
ncbi:cysteine desulfurase [Virgibacillus halodenitrificans]|uniref:cysteine desulfurase family protein n=1 Tax=Virgibacillus halodenitrificans TaxID=1482 RepID=UPI001FB2E1EA|nr:cysteine desulfurase family protein [Virgibacillus halodenitrificans]MCJ0930768.1 cysteine desulfurase [Virgibacillus halodenitrificans]WHX27600.1 cysteine desulfurase family protein [Virgibacillus halodenitrificans]